MNEEQNGDISPQSMPEPNYRQPGYRFILIGGIIGFVLGVLGNLVAAWVQDVVLANSFTLERVVVIGLITIVGLFIAALWDWRQRTLDSSPSPGKEQPQKDQVQMTWIQLWWSRLKIRGKGIMMKGVSSLGSKVDIDTRDKPQNQGEDDR